MASNSVNIITSQSETVTIKQPSNIITITDNAESSQVSVEITSPTNINLQEESISVVEVSSIGPQGPAGPQGPVQDTGSLLITSSTSEFSLTFTKGDGSTYTNIINSASYAVSSSYISGNNVDGEVAEATQATTATNANNVYVTHGSTTSTGWHLPMYRPTAGGGGYVDGNYPILNPINEIFYYQRTTNPITGDSQASDYLYIGGGQNTAGGIYLNSTVTRNNFIYSDYETFYIHAGGSSTGILNLSADSQVRVTSKLNISSSLYVDGIVDVTVSASSIHQIGSEEHILFTSYTGGNGTATINLPLVADSENRQIRIMTDESLSNSKDINIAPHSSDTSVTIDGSATFNMDRAYDGVMVMCHNSNWWIIQRKSK